MNVRALREFGLALRSGPFRVAFVLSLIVHLALLLVFGWGRLGRADGSERRIPLMRVRLLSPAPPVEVPAAPAIKPALTQPRGEQPGRPAAAVPQPPPASTPRVPAAGETSEVPVPAVEPVPELASVPEQTGRGEALEMQVPAETAIAPVSSALPPPLSPGAAQIALAPETGVAATVSAAVSPAPATEGSGSGGTPAAVVARGGYQVTGTAAAAAGNAGTASTAETPPRQGPGPRDLAAVRHRIDAHKVYPQIAVRNGWEGRVLVEMRLEGDGSLTTVRLLEGSGYAVLDDATIVAVRRASPFPPIARVLTVPVEYRLVP